MTIPTLALLPTSSAPTSDPSLTTFADDVLAALRELGLGATALDLAVGHRMVTLTLQLGKGLRLTDITRQATNIAFELGVPSVRITRGQAPRTVMLEVPRATSEAVTLHEVIDQVEMVDCALPLALGVEANGEAMVFDLAAAPHLLIAGATGSGKSSAVTAMLLSLLMANTPEAVEVCLIDPKQVDLIPFAGAPHVRRKVAVTAPAALAMLKEVAQEMDFRFTELKLANQPNLLAYNQWALQTAGEETMRHIVVVVDELAALVASGLGKEIETLLIQLAQLGRAAGIHLIAATQRPSAQVLSTQLRSQFPTRLSFRVATAADSRIILDQRGAETLLGAGDSLLRLSDGVIYRVQSAWLDRQTVERVVSALAVQYPAAQRVPDVPPVVATPEEEDNEWSLGAILMKLLIVGGVSAFLLSR